MVNVVYASVVVIALFFVFWTVYAYLAQPLGIVWDTAAEANPKAGDAVAGLPVVFAAAILVALIALGIWYFAVAVKKEHEVEYL